ncbi:hypothetical protein HDU97_004121 [Phlyctochytrium planicorne]|nr:hypothetical protein HDU97_004121 [Phlyctochytrium planicorne]
MNHRSSHQDTHQDNMPPRLPIETIQSIARLLDIKDAIKLMASCKSFYTSPLIQSICYREVNFSKTPLPTLAKYAPVIKKAKVVLKSSFDDVGGTDDTSTIDTAQCPYQEIGSKLTSLESLFIEIDNPTYASTLQRLVRLMESLPHPELLHTLWVFTYSQGFTSDYLIPDVLDGPLSRFTKVKRAALYHISLDQMSILENWTELEQLHVSRPWETDVEEEETLLPLPGLTKLTDVFLRDYNPDQTMAFLDAAPSGLKKITILLSEDMWSADLDGEWLDGIKNKFPAAHVEFGVDEQSRGWNEINRMFNSFSFDSHNLPETEEEE